ncbi:DUF4249 domain-containing protein [Cryomorpha ignava]|uniref:DUF4249 domain-containing protein n=1 Tax=Cryomorpha ignava TaxID=101383 RepID=A0A7K3WKU5_9FLAO|nr:DUF4249 domain-containing protein [Cryomorpha ignava]NEN22158.1 DUF4249 domain-containing protein [Cryomorpha ignava]
MKQIAACTLIGFLLLLLLSGCEKYLDFEGEDATPRLVLNGAFTTDSIFSVQLSNSSGYIDKNPLNTIAYGQVLVYGENGEIIDSLHHTENGIYTGSVLASANSSYSVVANAGSFGTVSAQDYIPVAVPIVHWDTATTSVTEYDYTSSRLQIEFTINDPAGINNFYVLEVYNTQYYYVSTIYDPNTGNMTYDTVYYDQPIRDRMYFSTSDQILLSESDLAIDATLYYSSGLSYSDALFNGKSQTFRILVESNYYGDNGNLELHLKSSSEAYYSYARTLEKYFYTEGDPFAQPVQVFSNIENGFGIWAGYSVAVVEL